MFVNPVFLPACIPVVTIPAAFTALNRVCIKLIHGRYTLVWLEFRDEFCRSFGRSFKTGLTLLPVFQYAFVLNAALDLPAWAILKNSRALTFLGLKYTIGILGITCFVDVAMLFGFLFPWCFWCWGSHPGAVHRVLPGKYPHAEVDCGALSSSAGRKCRNVTGSKRPAYAGLFRFLEGFLMTKLLLVRHGLSLANEKGFFAGQADVPLLSMGRLQAKATGEFLRGHYAVDKVYASDLIRAGETGKILSEILGCPLEMDRGLREIYAGAWQEKTFDYLTEHYPESYGIWRRDIGKAQCPEGESVAEMGLRVKEALAGICRENPGKTLAIATHATPIRAMECWAKFRDFARMGEIPWVSNASVTELFYEDGAWQLGVVSQDAHLQNLRTVFPANV